MKQTGRKCALCGKPGACATFLSLLIRWGIFNPPAKTNQFAHPACVKQEQDRRRQQ